MQEVHRKLTDKGWYIKSCIRTIGIITNSNHEFVLRSRLKTRSHQIKTDQQLTLLTTATLAMLLTRTSSSVIWAKWDGFKSTDRCFVDGCDGPIDPEYKADWLNGTALNSLLATPRAWRCNYQDFDTIPNATTPECAYKNYTVNATCHNWIFNKSVFTRTIVTDYLLVCDESWKITFGSFITMLGVLLGAFFLGPLPDLIGRRTSVVALGTWMAALGIGSCFAPNFDAFAGLRFLTGMGGIAVLQPLIIWGLEAQAPVMRIKFICLIYCFQSIGNLISGLLAYFIRDWIILQFCLFVPMGKMVVTYFILPESTRWLTVKKKYPEAKGIYENAAKLNKKIIPAYLLVISKKVTVDFPVAVHDMSVDDS
ncbi:solute carrier family 22 member 4-like [Daphnia magna]|uniref:solute carrier family 22 member 4-like n=1 Tax=Daphnia magna TaxID=35525 RepID=UPI001E1BAE15|nr:solute carrier family 22 member 4-like [Daphnia magna]